MISSFVFGMWVIYIFAAITAFAGTFLAAPISKNFLLDKKIELLLGYFFGLAFFVALWRVGDFVFQSSKIGLIFAIIPVIGLAIKQFIYYSKLLNSQRFWILLLIFLAIAIQILCTTFWAREVFSDVYSTLGSGHSPRYGNISIHGIEIDRVPVYGINYLQSLLSMLPMSIGGNSPLVYLSVWLGFSLFVLSLLSFFILRTVGLPFFYAAAGVILVNFGNTALSINQYLVMDTGSPFFLAGYSDTIHSIGVLFSIIAVLLKTTFHDKSIYSRIDKVKLTFGLGFLFYLNTILAPQNIIVTSALFGILFLRIFIAKVSNKRGTFFLQLGVFSLSLLIGTFSGGFLTPIKNQDPTDLPSINRLQISAFTPTFSPSMPYHLGSYHNWQMPKSDDVFVKATGSSLDKVLLFSSLLFESAYVLFFPILGIVLAFFFKKRSLEVRLLFLMALLTLLVGFVLVWPIQIYGSKWAQTRFFIPGIYFSQLCLCAGLYFSIQKLKPLLSKFVFVFAIVFICYGPTKNFLAIVTENFNSSFEFQRRLESLVNYSKIQKPN